MARWSDRPWERQKGESSKAYEAFSIYRDMGEKRTFIATSEKLQKSYTIIRRWKDQWGWTDRARAYDNELMRQELSEKKREFRDMQKRHIQTAMLMQKKAVQALDNLDPDSMLAKDIVQLIREATKLERDNRLTTEMLDDERDQIIYRMEIEDMDSIEKDVYDDDENS